MWPSVKLSGENECYLHENKKAICHFKILCIVPRFVKAIQKQSIEECVGPQNIHILLSEGILS